MICLICVRLRHPKSTIHQNTSRQPKKGPLLGNCSVPPLYLPRTIHTRWRTNPIAHTYNRLHTIFRIILISFFFSYYYDEVYIILRSLHRLGCVKCNQLQRLHFIFSIAPEDNQPSCSTTHPCPCAHRC